MAMNNRFVRFLGVGVAGFVVDSGVTTMLSRAGLSPITARPPAILLAMSVTWLLNRRFTFEVQVRKSFSELSRYLVVALLSSFLNFFLYCGLVRAGIVPAVAVAIATAALVLFSFFGYKRVAFQS
jgi:putative flippase GtrA